MPRAELHIVILRSGIVLLKRADDDWRALQDQFADYVTSVGAYTLAEALEWIELEWPDLYAACAAEIVAFAQGPAQTVRLS